MIDDKTINRNYSLPHQDNQLEDDVTRIKNAFESIDTDVHNLYNNKATLQETQNGALWYADSTGTGAIFEVTLILSLCL